MADDPILPPTSSDPPDPPVRRERREPIVCEFCECKLAPSGDVLRKSDRAKSLDRLQEKLERAESDRDGAVRDVQEANAKIAELEGRKRSGFQIPI